MLASLSATAVASENDDNYRYEEMLVTGGKDAIRTMPGSAAFLDEEAIAKFDATDINDLLSQVPGVYIRFEDGYGLRPNIGIRGATSERSQKLTLMEDSILIAPAPYSAPAAYYVPNINRMSAVEVFKGPSAIHYGPHTVGGALNLATPAVPKEAAGQLDVTAGNDNYQKYRATYGETRGQFGYTLDALHYSADGFKELDSGGDTGFERNDINAKLQWHSDDNASIQHQVTLKLGYADENSDETYLGLSDADFDNDATRRYSASQLDEFESEHTQLHLIHHADFQNSLKLVSKLYYNRFDRGWNKFDGFIDGPAAVVVLANPDIYTQEIALIRGETNANGTPEQTIDVTDFDREYGSQGAEFNLLYTLKTGAVSHKLESGLRFHHDYVERDHSQRGYLMQNGVLVDDGQNVNKRALNKAQTDAIALYLSDEIDYKKWKVQLGLRYENIDGEVVDELAADASNSQSIVLPGLGVFFQFSDELGFLFGVNKGFSPAGPGAGSEVDPEESVNFEYGFRYQRDAFSADIIGFFSDYENLLGRCRVSDQGCNAGDEFNGGDVEIAGAEVTTNYAYDLGNGLMIPVSLTYTYTESAFQSSFLSGFSQWNSEYFNGGVAPVIEGDELPYTPEHQGRLQVGLSNGMWSVDLAVEYIGQMREVPGAGSYDDATSTQSLTTVDLAASYQLTPQILLKIIGQNLTDEQEIVSRRPFGARPNQPLSLKVGATYSF
jgi:Fe(3+) dicitrate transport protein